MTYHYYACAMYAIRMSYGFLKILVQKKYNTLQPNYVKLSFLIRNVSSYIHSINSCTRLQVCVILFQ